MPSTIASRRWLLGGAVIAAAAVTAADRSLSFELVQGWMANALSLGLLALAAAVVISAGRIDISSGAAMSTVGMLIVATPAFATPGVGATLSGHALAALYIGLLYLLYHVATKAGVPSIIATLAGLLICKGVSTIIQTCLLGVGQICRDFGTHYGSASMLPQTIADFLDTFAFNLPLAALVVGALAYWRYRTRSGLEHVAVGMDEKAAHFARIDTHKVRGIAFSIAALLIFIATLLRLHGQNNGGWAPNTGWGEELLAIAIAVIGGTRVSGGYFDPLAVGLSAFAVYVWRDIIINDLGVPTDATSILFGLLLLVISWSDLRSFRVR
jgi:ribose/xylose/arabinose/galactoside ABC-type transport system permease subunit